MSPIISLYSSLLFLLIQSGCLSVKNQLRIVFFNGFNLIRCSDHQVLVYDYEVGNLDFIDETLICPNKQTIINNQYMGLLWTRLVVACSSDGDHLHEEIYVEKVIPGSAMQDLPKVISQVDASTSPADSDAINVDTQNLVYKLVTGDQLTTAWSSTHSTNNNEHVVYIWFEEHTVICRIVYSTSATDPCPSPLHEFEPEIVNETCFNDPNADHVPTVTELELELDQVAVANKSTNAHKYLLDLDIPVRSRQR